MRERYKRLIFVGLVILAFGIGYLISLIQTSMEARGR